MKNNILFVDMKTLSTLSIGKDGISLLMSISNNGQVLVPFPENVFKPFFGAGLNIVKKLNDFSIVSLNDENIEGFITSNLISIYKDNMLISNTTVGYLLNKLIFSLYDSLREVNEVTKNMIVANFAMQLATLNKVDNLDFFEEHMIRFVYCNKRKPLENLFIKSTFERTLLGEQLCQT